MKVTLLDIYRKSNYKISKNTNSGMGTGNNYGDNIVGKIEATTATTQTCNQYSGKTCTGMLQPKKLGFIISDKTKAINVPIPTEKKLTILVKIKIFNTSRRITCLAEKPIRYTGRRSFFLNLFILIRLV